MKSKDTPNPNKKKMTRHYSSPLPACFRPSTTATPALEYHAPPQAAATTTTTNPNLTTCLYQTHLGIFSLSWSKSLLSRSLHLSLSPTKSHSSPPSSPSQSPVFHLTLKPFVFWNKSGIKKLTFSTDLTSSDPKSIWVFWDFTSARFGPGPEPESGFYVSVLYEGEMTLLVGDLEREAYAKTRARRSKKIVNGKSPLVLRREHVVGKNKFYTTKIDLGGKTRFISIELNECVEDDPRLVIKFDQKRVFQVKHLKWKFRGSERMELDGHPIQISWDVYNWLFESDDQSNGNQDDGYALFTFRFETGENTGETGEVLERETGDWRREKGVMWASQDSCGLNYERKKLRKRLLMKNRSPSLSSGSISSVSSGCSSVLEWESVEENELKGPTTSGFSLLVYAWKS